MNEILCFFCKKDSHVTEYCPEFPTLRSRYSEIFKRGENICLCYNYEAISGTDEICKCRIICAVCFQHHHIAMCPKRDPDHRLNPILMPEPYPLFSHHSPFAQRFLELSNPIDQFKLQNCCSYFRNLQPISLKLKPTYSSDLPTPASNIVPHRSGIFRNEINIAEKISRTKCHFNFEGILLEDCYITKEDLKLLAKTDPYVIGLNSCTFDRDLSFQDFLNAFPYAFRFSFERQPLAKSDISNFLTAETKVGFKEITVCNDDFVDFDIEDLVKLLEQNTSLVVDITALDLPSNGILEKLEQHPRFALERHGKCELLCYFELPDLKYRFKFVPWQPWDSLNLQQ